MFICSATATFIHVKFRLLAFASQIDQSTCLGGTSFLFLITFTCI